MHGVCVWELRTMVTQDLTGGRSKVLSEFFIMARLSCMYSCRPEVTSFFGREIT